MPVKRGHELWQNPFPKTRRANTDTSRLRKLGSSNTYKNNIFILRAPSLLRWYNDRFIIVQLETYIL